MPVGYTPIFRIEHNGADVTDRFNTQTTQIQVDLTSGGGQNDTFRISIDDRGFKIQRPQVGEWLQIHLGYKEVGMSFVGLYEIQTVTFQGPPRSITLTGHGAGMTGVMKSPAIKEFENKSVGDILKEIGQKAGLPVEVSPELANKKVPYKNQVGTSNYHMIHELERHFGAVAKVWDGKLVFNPRDAGQDTEGNPMPSRVLRPEHFGTWSVRHDLRPEYSGVKTAYWDANENVTKWLEEKWQGLSGGDSGPAGEAPHRVNRKFGSEQEARDFAKSRLAALKRSTGFASIELAKGDPWIMPQMPIVITGMRDGIDGSYIADQVSHTYTKDTGIATKIEAKPPGDDRGAVDVSADELKDNAFLQPAVGERRGDYIIGPGGRVAGGV